MALDLAKLAVVRENQKQSSAHETRSLWEKRMQFVDLKRKFPALGTKEDEELLFDKERVAKRPKPTELAYVHFEPSLVDVLTCAYRPHVLKIKNRTSLDPMSPSAPSEPSLRPRDRTAMITNAIEQYLRRQKELDHHWDDQIDVRAFSWHTNSGSKVSIAESFPDVPCTVLGSALQVNCILTFTFN